MIRKLLVRLLRFFVKIGAVGRVISFKYQGKGVSLNSFYTQGHWTQRQELKNRYQLVFSEMLQEAKKKRVWMDKFYLLIFFNSKHDVDNVIGMEKIFTDTLKGTLIENDSKKYFKGIMIFHDENLPFNTFEFIMIEKND